MFLQFGTQCLKFKHGSSRASSHSKNTHKQNVGIWSDLMVLYGYHDVLNPTGCLKFLALFYSLLSSSGTSWNRPFASSTKPWWRVRTPSSPGKNPSTRSSPEWTTLCPTTSSPPTFWTRWS
ncbi:hypothetical protein AVEN_272744-1, partial [Araneus ventricosus]